MSDKSDDVRLADVCSDSFMLVLQLRASSDFGDSELLRERILSLLDNMESRARRENYNPEDIRNVKFALVAFIDETIIASDWSQKDIWLSNPLQLQLYNRFEAGEVFFQKLEELHKQIKINVQVLEVYYLCLVLGFKGKYGLVEQEKLRVIIDEIYQDIIESTDESNLILSPTGKIKEEITEVIKKEIPTWIIATGAAALGLLFYIVMVLMGTGTANKVLQIIREML